MEDEDATSPLTSTIDAPKDTSGDTGRTGDVGDSGRPSFGVNIDRKEEPSNTYHYLSFGVRKADIRWWLQENKLKYVHVVCEIVLHTKETNIYRSKIVWYSYGKPNFGFNRRFRFVNGISMPNQVDFNIRRYDPNAEGNGDDEIIAKLVVPMNKDHMCEHEKFHMHKKHDLDPQGTLRIDFNYRQCSSEMMQNLMKDRRNKYFDTIDNERKKLNKHSRKWIDDNRMFFVSLKRKLEQNLPLVSNDFGDMIFPPYELIKDDYALFISEFARVQRYYATIVDGNDDVEESKMEEGSDENMANENGFQAFYDKENDMIYYDEVNAEQYGGINVSAGIQIMWRYVYLRNVLLSGQDSEFNIYRSYYFEPSPEKVSMAMLSLVIQIGLIICITVDVVEDLMNRIEYYEDNDRIKNEELELDTGIVVMAVLVFCYLASLTNSTVKLFQRFYTNIHLVYQVPWTMIVADFLSNVVIATWVAIISLLFLALSPSRTELVLNSFALTFIFEVDDWINTFESDEEFVIIADLRSFEKAGCQTPRQIKVETKDMLKVLYTPAQALQTMFIGIKSFWHIFVAQEHRAEI